MLTFQADSFLNLEDDVVPVPHFVRLANDYVTERELAGDEWSSLQFSNYLSIGRWYRCRDLARLVDLILISYSRMPVDFIMHHFDVMEMTDHFREFRRRPPLLEHGGVLSTLDVESKRARVTRQYEAFKKANPPARLTSNMTQWENFRLEAAYRPAVGHFFWAHHVRSGDVIDMRFDRPLGIKAVFIVTGFDREEERGGHDRMVNGTLWATDHHHCGLWRPLKAEMDERGKLATTNISATLPLTRCLRLQVWKGTSHWLVVRLIRVIYH